MASNSSISWAPDRLWQNILGGWTFAGTVINFASSNSDAELHIVEKIASYGKQLGRISEALEVVVKFVAGQRAKLTDDDRKAVDAFTRMVEEIKDYKESIEAH